jgi:hypothetical protein
VQVSRLVSESYGGLPETRGPIVKTTEYGHAPAHFIQNSTFALPQNGHHNRGPFMSGSLKDSEESRLNIGTNAYLDSRSAVGPTGERAIATAYGGYDPTITRPEEFQGPPPVFTQLKTDFLSDDLLQKRIHQFEHANAQLSHISALLHEKKSWVQHMREYMGTPQYVELTHAQREYMHQELHSAERQLSQLALDRQQRQISVMSESDAYTRAKMILQEKKQTMTNMTLEFVKKKAASLKDASAELIQGSGTTVGSALSAVGQHLFPSEMFDEEPEELKESEEVMDVDYPIRGVDLPDFPIAQRALASEIGENFIGSLLAVDVLGDYFKQVVGVDIEKPRSSQEWWQMVEQANHSIMQQDFQLQAGSGDRGEIRVKLQKSLARMRSGVMALELVRSKVDFDVDQMKMGPELEELIVKLEKVLVSDGIRVSDATRNRVPESLEAKSAEMFSDEQAHHIFHHQGVKFISTIQSTVDEDEDIINSSSFLAELQEARHNLVPPTLEEKLPTLQSELSMRVGAHRDHSGLAEKIELEQSQRRDEVYERVNEPSPLHAELKARADEFLSASLGLMDIIPITQADVEERYTEK